MTIAKGAPWGERGPVPTDTVGGLDDAGARAVVESARQAGAPVPPLGLVAGDLLRTVGGRAVAETRGADDGDALLLPADLGAVLLDGRPRWFVAHLLARGSWFRGRIVAVMNAQYLREWDVAPRSHPGDGKLDLMDMSPAMSLRDRWRARARMATGTHVPHPAVTVQQFTSWTTRFDPPLDVTLDGVSVGPATEIAVQVEPDALLLVV